MQKLSSALSSFIATNNSFENPFDDGIIEEISDVIEDRTPTTYPSTKKGKKNKKKKSKDINISEIEESLEDIKSKVFDEDELINDFDTYLDEFMLDDEDDEVRQNLISYGRKYARDNKISGELSEIQKTFANSEKKLSELIDQIDTDSNALQKDITQMRMAHTRSYKNLSDMIQTKATLHNVKLSSIKELNSMKKTVIELQMKSDKNKKEEAHDDALVNRAISNLFSMNRANFVNYGEDADDDVVIDSDDNGVSMDDVIQRKYFNKDDAIDEDGDKFIRYEGQGVHYVLLYDDNGNKEVIAEDKNGELVPDYPLPSNIEELDFNISENTGTATDNYANQYKLRKTEF